MHGEKYPDFVDQKAVVWHMIPSPGRHGARGRMGNSKSMSNVRSHHILLGREKVVTRLRDAIVGPEGESSLGSARVYRVQVKGAHKAGLYSSVFRPAHSRLNIV